MIPLKVRDTLVSSLNFLANRRPKDFANMTRDLAETVKADRFAGRGSQRSVLETIARTHIPEKLVLPSLVKASDFGHDWYQAWLHAANGSSQNVEDFLSLESNYSRFICPSSINHVDDDTGSIEFVYQDSHKLVDCRLKLIPQPNDLMHVQVSSRGDTYDQLILVNMSSETTQQPQVRNLINDLLWLSKAEHN